MNIIILCVVIYLIMGYGLFQFSEVSSDNPDPKIGGLLDVITVIFWPIVLLFCGILSAIIKFIENI